MTPEDGAHEGGAGEKADPRVGGTDAPQMRVRDAGADTTVVRAGWRFREKESKEMQEGTWRHGQGTKTQTGRKSSFPIKRHRRTLWRSFSPLPQLQWGFRLEASRLYSMKTGFILGD